MSREKREEKDRGNCRFQWDAERRGAMCHKCMGVKVEREDVQRRYEMSRRQGTARNSHRLRRKNTKTGGDAARQKGRLRSLRRN